MDLEEMQKEVDNWVKTKGGYWKPLSQLARLTEEHGELSRVMNYLHGTKGKRKGKI